MKSSHLLQEARRRAGLTQAEFARRVGTSQSAIARWESGGVRPPLETLARLVRACGFELSLSLEPVDGEDAALIEHNLSLTPAQRLDQLARTVALITAGRASLRSRAG